MAVKANLHHVESPVVNKRLGRMVLITLESCVDVTANSNKRLLFFSAKNQKIVSVKKSQKNVYLSFILKKSKILSQNSGHFFL